MQVAIDRTAAPVVDAAVAESGSDTIVLEASHLAIHNHTITGAFAPNAQVQHVAMALAARFGVLPEERVTLRRGDNWDVLDSDAPLGPQLAPNRSARVTVMPDGVMGLRR